MALISMFLRLYAKLDLDMTEVKTEEVLKRIGDLQRELEYMKRDLIRLRAGKSKSKPSLFGSVRGGDISSEMIEQSKKDLFRELEDV